MVAGRGDTSTTDAYLAYCERMRFAFPHELDAGHALDTLKPSLDLLRALHEAHLLSIPFENLSIHYHQPIVLETEALYDKIVSRHRGGFCYELNGLFAWLLSQLGYQVALLSARVAETGGDFSPDFDHLALGVYQLDGADWLADVGFGDSFRHPLRLIHEAAQDGADGQTYRLLRSQSPREEGSGGAQPFECWTVERLHESGRWEPQYRFSLQPHQLADFTDRCQYHQTSPDSHFTQKRICSLGLPAGRITLSDFRLITTTGGKRAERTLQSEEEYRLALAEQFGVTI